LLDDFSGNKKEADSNVYLFVVEISGIESLTLCGFAAHPPQADLNKFSRWSAEQKQRKEANANVCLLGLWR
jgi:hypothetical protein